MALFPGCMQRYDATGRALLVCDAPRRGFSTPDAGAGGMRILAEGDLLYIDLPREAYASLLSLSFSVSGPWIGAWFEEQALLLGILRAGGRHTAPCAPDEPLLRAAMIACALGVPSVRVFLRSLRLAHAEALRKGSALSCRACAALCAHTLYAECGVAIPFANGHHADLGPRFI